ncbi:MAG: anaerobic ribonucleoside-triphosphate reductase [Methanomassiliicoccaceae archaeon]|jgi:anaerobic ribonucleoside-triphosphate reductase|nr:anaerobic ribonucleoside-triphosphate reductase [Euryarchaeota archaeon]HOB37509.1 anaerobic ribonucleoside-triphosphate reductase [Methanomassiliicoccaceae archaeon]HQD87390.1 anaerobic ribonucleoside-triphosphate reductase [Methanomassiliicoccaceae archaeon]
MKATESIHKTTELIPDSRESTELTLFVRTSDEELKKWDRVKIYDALLRETSISEDAASIVAREVEKMIAELEIEFVTAPLIRELTNAKLVEYGLSKIRKQHTRLGVPLYDARQIIMAPNKENANVPHGPEATNLTLAENIKKEFALLEVFSQDLADAHMRGDIHLHDLGMVDRPYCSGQSIEYVKKFGLNLPNALSIAKPAKHPEVLIEQIIKFSAALQGHFAGAIGWDAFNLFLAPYLVGVDDKRMKQLAQILVYEFAQQAVARGGQSIFSDLNLYWEIPDHFSGVPAIGPGGEFTGKTYDDYLPEAQRFVKALFDVYEEGDAMGRPFFFPKPNVHMTDKFFQTEGHEEFLEQISRVAAEKGNTYFVFDRGGTAKISECCRLSFKLEESDLEDAKTPWKMRYSAMQNVTINLPRIAYEAHQDDTKLFQLLTQRIEMAAQAHIQKREFISQLLNLGKDGPLSLLTMNLDGEPYYRIDKSSFLIGMVGLNEMVQYHLGKQMHEGKDAMMFGLKIISYMKQEAERIGNEYGLKMPLEQTPAESTAYRFAKLDMKYYPLQAPTVIRGNKSTGEIYYTNSTYLNVGADVSAIDRVKMEGRFHPLIDAGSMTHVWLGESKPPAESIAAFVKKTFETTQNAQIAFSPEFTSCLSCGRTHRGLRETCPSCSSPDVEGITRVTGFFSKTRGWNKGKLGELRDRTRNIIG